MGVRVSIDVAILARCAMDYIVINPQWAYPSLLAAIEQQAANPVYCAEMHFRFMTMLTTANPLGKKYKIKKSHARDLSDLVFGNQPGKVHGIEVPLEPEWAYTEDEICDDLIDVALFGKAEYIVSERPALFTAEVTRLLTAKNTRVVKPVDLIGHLASLPY